MLGIFNRETYNIQSGIVYIYIHIYTYTYILNLGSFSPEVCFPRSPRCPAARWQMRRIVPCTRRSGHESCVVSRGFDGDVMGIYEIYWIYGIITVKSLWCYVIFTLPYILWESTVFFWIYGNIWFTTFFWLYMVAYIYDVLGVLFFL